MNGRERRRGWRVERNRRVRKRGDGCEETFLGTMEQGEGERRGTRMHGDRKLGNGRTREKNKRRDW